MYPWLNRHNCKLLLRIIGSYSEIHNTELSTANTTTSVHLELPERSECDILRAGWQDQVCATLTLRGLELIAKLNNRSHKAQSFLILERAAHDERPQPWVGPVSRIQALNPRLHVLRLWLRFWHSCYYRHSAVATCERTQVTK